MDIYERYAVAIDEIGGPLALQGLPEAIKSALKGISDIEDKVEFLEGLADGREGKSDCQKAKDRYERLLKNYMKDKGISLYSVRFDHDMRKVYLYVYTGSVSQGLSIGLEDLLPGYNVFVDMMEARMPIPDRIEFFDGNMEILWEDGTVSRMDKQGKSPFLTFCTLFASKCFGGDSELRDFIKRKWNKSKGVEYRQKCEERDRLRREIADLDEKIKKARERFG